MSVHGRIWIPKPFGLALALILTVPVSIAWSAPGTVKYAGEVVAVDKTTGKIVVGDMGPLLANGTSTITPRSIQVTRSTEFARVRRSEDAAPNGWTGDFVENTIHAWDVRPGDFVTIQVKPDTQVAQALKVTVVDTHEPFTLEGIRHF